MTNPKFRTIFSLLCFTLFSVLNVSRASEKLDSKIIVEILPGKPYFGVRMRTGKLQWYLANQINTKIIKDEPLMVKVNKKYLNEGRYQLECFSAGPDPQGELIVTPLFSNEELKMSQNIFQTLLSKVLPHSFIFTQNELLNTQFVCSIVFCAILNQSNYPKIAKVSELSPR
ncbi:hypothetical protein HWI79_2811 [Cryptosporidium felis]|nr:hypothetical protein HWI79_2811 [Cryptosporidium felis]